MRYLQNHCRPRPGLLLVVAALALPAGARGIGAQEYDVDRQATNQVRFVSQTTIQDFDGTTDHIDGYVLLGKTPLGPASADSSELYFEVDLASLDTGIGLRNRHMRDDYLEVDKYPFATYKGRIVQVDSTAAGFSIAAAGTFSIHGVDKTMSISCAVTVAGDGYRSMCSFPVLLSDFKIDIPKVMFLKLNDQIQLNLDFTVAPAQARRGGGPS